jgi:modulator of FtsH protease
MPDLYELSAWQPFLSVAAGAGATLCGLVFVGLALNLDYIRRSSALIGRAGEAITVLLSIVVAALAGLIPHAPQRLTGGLLLFLGALEWVFLVRLQVAAYEEQKERYFGYFVLRVVLGQLAMLPLIAAGISLLAGAGGGMLWMAFGLAMSLAVGVIDAWVLAIEIVR